MIFRPRTIAHRRATPPQREFWGSTAKFRLYVGGVGAGKTRAGAIEALRMPRGSIGAVVAPTYPMLRDATLRTFLDLARRARILKSFHKQEMVVELAGQRTILFRTADIPDRLRGPNLGWFWFDEGAMTQELAYLIMVGRLRLSPGIGWITSTPRGKNWLYKTFVEGGDRYHVVRASSRSNPYLPTDFVPTLEEAYDANFAAQEIEGEFLDDTFGQLIPDWHIDRIPTLQRPDCPGGPRWITCDLGEGGGRDSTVILVGDELGILHGEESPWVGPAHAAFRIRELKIEFDVRDERIVFDRGGGRGLDIEPYLAQHGITDALAYKGSRTGGDHFLNRRSKMAWQLRQRLDPERPRPAPPPPLRHDAERTLSIFDPPEPIRPSEYQAPFTIPHNWALWRLLAEELKSLRWFHKGKQIALEPKEELQKRIKRSPNVCDALLMRFQLGEFDIGR